MSDRREAAQVLALCSWVKKQISKIEDKAKEVADVTYPDEKMAAVINDKVVAYTSRVQRKPELKYDDTFAFTEWVSKHYPTEIEWAVRPRFLTELRDRAIEQGAILGPGGEVCEVAELDEPIVYTTTRLQKDADDVLWPLLSGLLLADLPDFITGAPEPAQPEVKPEVTPEPTDRWTQDAEAGAIG